MKNSKYFILLFYLLLITNCTPKPGAGDWFQLLEVDHTRLDFSNSLEQTTSFNVFDYMYFFNGGGVGIGDFNNDGLVDLYFSANMESNKMFLNEGDLRFKDVTQEAGVQGTDAWSTGISVIDINNDGLLDIYVNVVGDYDVLTGVNQLYVCLGIEDGIPRYEDQAVDYGLDLVGFGTQAAFVDFDLDGDLDMYQLNHSLHQNGTFGPRDSFEGKMHPTAGDKYLENQDGVFKDVTGAVGIKSTVIGYGLGLSIGDLNFDGWPDIYIGNDFHENDYLYLNNTDGTFSEVLTKQIMHTSRFSMGTDIGDINNDGNPEVISLDMLPYDPYILKSSLGEDGYDVFKFKKSFGYNDQFARNNLQLNHGDNTYSEIGLFSGIYATDWSWAPLFMDFDNDGYNDLFVSNGIPRRMNDIDYANFQFSSEEQKQKTLSGVVDEKDLKIIEKMPQIKIPNRFFSNTGTLKFEDKEDLIFNNKASYSNGAHYADLDNDGDLDIVVNNIDDHPFIYKNLAAENGKTGNYLHINLQGPTGNINAVGARIVVVKKDELLVKENFPVRGFMSSSNVGLHVGVGDTADVENVYIVWPDRSCQEIKKPIYNKPMTAQWSQKLPFFDFEKYREKRENKYNFLDITDSVKLDFTHQENSFVEFNREPLIPYMVSSEGPALAVGDINGDGLDDVFIGGAKRKRAAFFLQNSQGTFQLHEQKSLGIDSTYEDVDAVLVDVENDGDLDLVVASGGNEYRGESDYRKSRLYLNDGQGNFQRTPAFDNAYMTASCVLPADFDKDGLVDLFFGARAVPKVFGETPTSYLFRNLGDGTFEDVTDAKLPKSGKLGMVQNGVWLDIDQEGDQDLILALDWGPVQLLQNTGQEFKTMDISATNGWWNFVLTHDFDQDGDLDIIAGNTGMNSRFKPSTAAPVKIYLNDFDDDGLKEQILTYEVAGKEIPFATHAELTKRLVSLKKDYLYAKDMANASLEDLFGRDKLSNAFKLEVQNAQSMFFENQGGLKFQGHALPGALQFSQLQNGLVKDLDNDGMYEVFLAGNFKDNNIEMGTYDANYGNVLEISGAKDMKVWDLGEMKIKGQVKRVESITINGKNCLIIAKNNDRAQVLYLEAK